MTLEEKIGQLVMTGIDSPLGPDAIETGRTGSLISFNDAAAIAEAQAKARNSRLGIPLLVGLDLLHGFRTLFPVPLAEAASFDPALAARNAELAAREAVPAGLNWTFAPMVDVGRDPRWGRIVEGAGEDVRLAMDFAAARARGFRAGGIAPTLKHFAGYGAVAGGRDYDAVSVSDYELQNLHLPPFRASLGPMTTVMSALTVTNGIPASSDVGLLRGLLRDQWKFNGVIVSDWGAIDGLVKQGTAQDAQDAVRQAMAAGVDIDMASGFYAAHLAGEVKAGRIAMSNLDAAVRRVLALKFELGLFDKPIADPDAAEKAALTPELRTAARETVRKSAVLLKNENQILPLKPDIKKIAVVGPFADNAFEQLGPHEARGRPEDAVTLLKGITERAKGNGIEILHAPGCDVTCYEDKGFRQAIEAAKSSDLVIAVLGEKREFSGEGASRAFLDFWGRQEDLLEALAATGKPVVLVIVAGRPLDLRRASEIVPSILMAWYPGTEGGNGIADILFGDEAPSAKLPISWPRSVGQSPFSYDTPASGRPYVPDARYVLRLIDENPTPLYPFGHGLTYTKFAYSDLRVAPVQSMNSVAQASITLKNAGSRPGTEIVQLYVRDVVASRVRPVRELKQYRRVSLAPGQSETVTFLVTRDELGFRDERGELIVEPGDFKIGIGADSTTELAAGFTLEK
ncbi:beta-glucosidase [Terrihabitans soli]|uniref:beta-glucosidase n=2 Tax=Terrihabitans soli TaxID=708113 RepID=A0A6S6QYD9_9HYPH|nr:beta-glucosidase [Terrihabitans soli]